MQGGTETAMPAAADTMGDTETGLEWVDAGMDWEAEEESPELKTNSRRRPRMSVHEVS